MPIYGYARVSTLDQDLTIQRAALKAAGFIVQLSLTLAISDHALVQKCGSEAMWSRAASSGMVAMPNGPDAPQRWPFHQSTCTLSASPVGLSLASGAPVRWLVSM